jgi:hypothetical protein
MATTLFKEVRYDLNTLIANIDLGIIGLPDIQRPFVWKNVKVKQLFDSMYKGYPVGYFLFWQTPLEGGGEKGIGTDAKQKAPSLLIVDGQQRLTSLYAVLKSKEVVRENYDKEKIVISFKPTTGEFEVPDAATRRSPEYVQDISVLWDPETDLYDFITVFLDTLSSSREVPKEERKLIQKAINKLKTLESYPFSALELLKSVSEEDVSDVFVRINSEGKKLNQADFILTIMSVFWDEGRLELEEFCRDARTAGATGPSAYNYLIWPDPDQMLRVAVGLAFQRARLQYVYSILRGKDLRTGEFSEEQRDEQFGLLKTAQSKVLNLTNWHEYLKAVQQAGYQRGDFISSKNNLIYCYLMFLIGREQFKMDYGTLRRLIARWFFMTSLTGRYTGSPESRMENDLASLREAESVDDFAAVINGFITQAFTSDFWTISLPGELATSASRGASLFGYYAALDVLDARGLFSSLRINNLLTAGIKSKKSALERHHLFPKAHLRKQGIADKRTTNQIANFALVEWGDNISISDAAPAEYLPVQLVKLTPEEQQKQYHHHALWEGWEHTPYRDFLEERRRRIAGVIQEAWNKLDA